MASGSGQLLLTTLGGVQSELLKTTKGENMKRNEQILIA